MVEETGYTSEDNIFRDNDARVDSMVGDETMAWGEGSGRSSKCNNTWYAFILVL